MNDKDSLATAVNLIMLAVILFWALAVIIAPYLAPAGSIRFDDEGVVGEHEHEHLTSNISSGFARWVYESGDGACHQRASRSFFLNGNQMPYCARCTAIFGGLAIGIAIPLFVMITDVKWWLLAVGFVPIGIDGTVQLVTSYESNNAFRLATGLLAGVVTSILIGFIIEEYVKLYREHQEKKKAQVHGAGSNSAAPNPQQPQPEGAQVGTFEEDIQPPMEQNTILKK